MKVKYVPIALKRRDGQKGNPTAVTAGKVYDVVEHLHDEGQYTILNDQFKLARYDVRRFEVVDCSSILPLRFVFNTLTTPLRSRIKELEKQLEFYKGEK